MYNNPVQFHYKISLLSIDAVPYNRDELDDRDLRRQAYLLSKERHLKNGDDKLPVVFVIDDNYNILHLAVEHGYSPGWDQDLTCSYDVILTNINNGPEFDFNYDRGIYFEKFNYNNYDSKLLTVKKSSPVFFSYEEADICRKIIIGKIITKNKLELMKLKTKHEAIVDGKMGINVSFDSDYSEIKLRVRPTSFSSSIRNIGKELQIELQQLASEQYSAMIIKIEEEVRKFLELLK